MSEAGHHGQNPNGERGSPDWLTAQIDHCFEVVIAGLARWFARDPSAAWMSSALTCIGAFVLCRDLRDVFDYLSKFHARQFTFEILRLPALLPILALPRVLLRECKRTWGLNWDLILTLVVFVTGVSLYAFFRTPWLGPSKTLLNLLIHLSIPVGFFMISQSWRPGLRMVWLLFGIIVAMIITDVGAVTAPRVWGDNWITLLTDRLFLPLSVLIAEFAARIDTDSLTAPANLRLLLSPLTIFYPLPVFSKDRRVHFASSQLFASGLVGFIKGCGAFALACWALPYRELPWLDGFLRTICEGFLIYYITFLFSYSILTVAVAAGQWLGFDLPAGYRAPLLASSPTDRWRRWNTYLYQWSFTFAFVPTLRRTKSTALAVAAAFFAIFLLHASIDLVRSMIDTKAIDSVWWVRNRLVHFTLHGILVYVSLKFPRLWPSGQTRMGWIGVVVLQFLMALIHWAAYI